MGYTPYITMSQNPIFIFAHGAGKGIDSDWIISLGNMLSEHQIDFRPFEFPYMQKRKRTGKKSPPDRLPVLLDTFNAIISDTQSDVYIGGKSMGGRIATMVADTHDNVRGVIAYGYPFHPPAKPETLRTAHLQDIKTPTLIIQGTNDPFGKQQEWDNFMLSDTITLHPMDKANHDLKPLKSTGYNIDDYLKQASQITADFIQRHK